MRPAWTLILSCACLWAVGLALSEESAPASAMAWVSYQDPAKEFSLDIPAEWKADAARKDASVVFLSGGAPFNVNISVSKRPTGGKDDAVEAQLARAHEQLDGYTEHEVRLIKLGGRNAHLLAASYKTKPGGLPLKFQQLFVERDGMLYSVVGMARAEDFDKYQPIFAKSLSSFRLGEAAAPAETPKPEPPAAVQPAETVPAPKEIAVAEAPKVPLETSRPATAEELGEALKEDKGVVSFLPGLLSFVPPDPWKPRYSVLSPNALAYAPAAPARSLIALARYDTPETVETVKQRLLAEARKRPKFELKEEQAGTFLDCPSTMFWMAYDEGEAGGAMSEMAYVFTQDKSVYTVSYRDEVKAFGDGMKIAIKMFETMQFLPAGSHDAAKPKRRQ